MIIIIKTLPDLFSFENSLIGLCEVELNYRWRDY